MTAFVSAVGFGYFTGATGHTVSGVDKPAGQAGDLWVVSVEPNANVPEGWTDHGTGTCGRVMSIPWENGPGRVDFSHAFTARSHTSSVVVRPAAGALRAEVVTVSPGMSCPPGGNNVFIPSMNVPENDCLLVGLVRVPGASTVPNTTMEVMVSRASGGNTTAGHATLSVWTEQRNAGASAQRNGQANFSFSDVFPHGAGYVVRSVRVLARGRAARGVDVRGRTGRALR